MTIYAIGVLMAITLVAAITDYKKQIIPNWLVVTGMVLALLLQTFGFLKESWSEFATHFLIFFIPLMLMWIIGTLTSFQALAGGDVKFISVMAMFTEPKALIYILLVSMLLLSVINVSKLSFSFYKEAPKEIYYFIFFGIPGKEKSHLQKVPFGPYLVIGTFSVIFYLHYF